MQLVMTGLAFRLGLAPDAGLLIGGGKVDVKSNPELFLGGF